MKMKKAFSIFMVITILMVFSSCGVNKNTSKTNSTESIIKDTGEKIEGTITGSSVFHEGLAFVCLDEEKTTTYCINKKGNIVFEINKQLVSNGNITDGFVNGLALLDGAIYDTTGKITLPEDVGATKFYSVAFAGGYVLAEKITADYSSTKKELGIMNKNFEWVLQPSEALYNSLEESLWQTEVLNTKSFYYNDTIYFEGCQRYLNIKTGKVSETSNVKQPSSSWSIFSDGYGAYSFGDCQDKIILDLSEKKNIYEISRFQKGKSAIIFKNVDADKYYLTLIDETGSFIFEPVEIKNMPGITSLAFDGDYIVVSGEERRSGDYVELFQCYDSDGKIIGSLDTGDFGSNLSNSCDIGDGVITIQSGYNYSHTCYYYNPDFTPLF